MLKTNMLKWNHVAILKQRVHSWCWNNFMFIDTGYVYHGKHTFRVRGVFCPEDPAPLKGGYAVYKLLNMPFFKKNCIYWKCALECIISSFCSCTGNYFDHVFLVVIFSLYINFKNTLRLRTNSVRKIFG